MCSEKDICEALHHLVNCHEKTKNGDFMVYVVKDFAIELCNILNDYLDDLGMKINFDAWTADRIFADAVKVASIKTDLEHHIKKAKLGSATVYVPNGVILQVENILVDYISDLVCNRIRKYKDEEV